MTIVATLKTGLSNQRINFVRNRIFKRFQGLTVYREHNIVPWKSGGGDASFYFSYFSREEEEDTAAERRLQHRRARAAATPARIIERSVVVAAVSAAGGAASAHQIKRGDSGRPTTATRQRFRPRRPAERVEMVVPWVHVNTASRCQLSGNTPLLFDPHVFILGPYLNDVQTGRVRGVFLKSKTHKQTRNNPELMWTSFQ